MSKAAWILAAPKGVMLDATAPLVADDGGGLFGGYFSSKKRLLEENTALKVRVMELEVLALANKRLREENEELKKEVGRFSGVHEEKLAAILARPNRIPYDTLVLDIGAEDSVAEGNLVLAGEDSLLGRVAQVFKKTSQVILYSAPGETLDVIVGPDNVSAIAEGNGGGNSRISLPRDIAVSEGDLIIAPSIDSLTLGVVGVVNANPADAFQEIMFKTPVNIQELRWVRIRLD